MELAELLQVQDNGRSRGETESALLVRGTKKVMHYSPDGKHLLSKGRFSLGQTQNNPYLQFTFRFTRKNGSHRPGHVDADTQGNGPRCFLTWLQSPRTIVKILLNR